MRNVALAKDLIFYFISVKVYFKSRNTNIYFFTVLVLTTIRITLEMMLSLAKMKCTTFFVPYTLALP